MKTSIKHILAVLILLISTLTAQAQVKIGNNPTSINGGSLLELESTNKGLLMPRINLTNTTTWGLSGTAVAGMHVYNTNTGITSTNTAYPTLVAKIGEYYWDGTGWVALAPVGTQDAPVQFSVKKSAANQVPPTVPTFAVVNFNAVDYDKNSNFNLATDEFVVPANGAGLYQLNITFITNATAISQGIFCYLFVNGVSTRNLSTANSSAGSGVAGAGSIAVRFNAGDVVTIRMAKSFTSEVVTVCQFDCYLISK